MGTVSVTDVGDMWLDPDSFQKQCGSCMDWKSVCVIDGVHVSKRKCQEPKERLGLRWKKMQVEMELELESDGSGEDGWRAWGLHYIAFSLLGLWENLEERNQLFRELNGFLQRIALCLERTRVVEALEQDLDTTMRIE